MIDKVMDRGSMNNDLKSRIPCIECEHFLFYGNHTLH